MANQFLAVLIALMIVRDGALAIRHRRPFRIAFVVFWVLLGIAHLTDRQGFYPLVAVAIAVAMILKRREHFQLVRMFGPGYKKITPPGSKSAVWDREIDGYL